MTHPHIGVRIPPDHKTKLEGIATSTGRTLSQVVQDAIASYLGDSSQSNLSTKLVVIERRLDALEEGQRAVKALIR